MGIVEKSLESQLANIEGRTGKTLDELLRILEESELEKHGELRDLLKSDLGMGHGDANTLVHVYRQRGEDAPTTLEGQLDRIYSGAREDLRPIHNEIMRRVEAFGEFEARPRRPT